MDVCECILYLFECMRMHVRVLYVHVCCVLLLLLCVHDCMSVYMYVHNYACLYMMYVCSYIFGCMIGGGW